MSEPVGDDGFRLKPQVARLFDNRSLRDPDAWFYEEPHGISVVSSSSIRAHVFIIPAHALRRWARTDSALRAEFEKGEG